ncbi:unnamed protein product [Spirodela intermedia]|uniref:FAD-dependent oxidoreductase domain-containing protein 1 n=1 Tax=Spirodela intermedia TaxID=51605 RepID=A0A7I8IQC2_SPIIN|nr:unnamed protein product [Spirodela intermedia]CAA6660130.1 unnamed protein product [Spirodela intermedia]
MPPPPRRSVSVLPSPSVAGGENGGALPSPTQRWRAGEYGPVPAVEVCDSPARLRRLRSPTPDSETLARRGIFDGNPARGALCSAAAAKRGEYDVVIVGAGIIGLTVARQFLIGSDLSVAVVDARVPCSGATGAGQGYIWMANKTPGSDTWELACRGKQLWEDLAESIRRQGMDPLRNFGELSMLQKRVKMLNEAGLKAEYLSASALASREPSLDIGPQTGAAFLPDDCQLDALRAVSFIEQGNRSFVPEGRYAEFFNDPAVCLVRSTENGEVEAVQTSQNILCGRRAVVIATGAWSGFLDRTFMNTEATLDVPVEPRKGHLLLLENLDGVRLNHGLMEVGYVDHQVSSRLPDSSSSRATAVEHNFSSISFTATTDHMGNLLLGSSRQFSGFDVEVDDAIIKRIWERAGEFLPTLREIPSISPLRMPDGKPIIGPIPGIPKALFATGHEGGGLCMALSTAEMVVDMVLGNGGKIDHSPFSVRGRCCV